MVPDDPDAVSVSLGGFMGPVIVGLWCLAGPSKYNDFIFSFY